VIYRTSSKIDKITLIYAHTAIFDIVRFYSLAEFIKFQSFTIFKAFKDEEKSCKLACTFIFCSLLLYKV